MFKGEDIRKKRKELHLSAKSLADQIGVNVDNLYKWEKGHTPTNPEDFIKVESWLSGKLETIPRKIGTSSNNAPVRPQEAQQAPDYRDEVILLLKEKISLNESKMLLLIQRNHALLNAVVETLPKLVRAIHLAQDGADPFIIMQLFRHSHLGITQSYLRDLAINLNREAVEKGIKF